MTDDFFDNFDEGLEVGGDIGAFLKRGQGGVGTQPNEHPDVMDVNKLLLTQGSEDASTEDTAAASYSEAFETENNKSESYEKERRESEASSEYSETAHGSHVASASQKSETQPESVSSENNKVSLQQKSKKTPEDGDENDRQQGTLFQSIDERDSKPEWTRFQTQKLSESEASEREKEGSVETVKTSHREEKKRQAIREWIERKIRESSQRRKDEARKLEERTKQEEEETERKKKQDDKRRQRNEVELKEWYSRKAREEKEAMLRLQEEVEEIRRIKEARAARSTHIYLTWLAAHPPTSTHRHTAQAYTGDRIITYYDRARPATPVYRNPEPWRRC